MYTKISLFFLAKPSPHMSMQSNHVAAILCSLLNFPITGEHPSAVDKGNQKLWQPMQASVIYFLCG